MLAFKEQSDVFEAKMNINSISSKVDLIKVNLQTELSHQA